MKQNKGEKTLKQKQEEIEQKDQLKMLNKSIETVESAVLSLNNDFAKVKEDAQKIDAKIEEYGEQRINPLIDQLMNQRKANESLFREQLRTASQASQQSQNQNLEHQMSIFDNEVDGLFSMSNWDADGGFERQPHFAAETQSSSTRAGR